MRPIVLGFGLVAATGCAQLAGIDKTTSKDSSASLTIDRTSVGATVSTAPQDLAGQTAAFLHVSIEPSGDLVSTDADLDPTTATWTAESVIGPPEVQFTLPDRDVVHLDALGAHVIDELVALEHPNPMPADGAASVAATLTLPVAWNGTDTFAIDIIGPWATHAVSTVGAVAGTDTTIADTIDYADFAGPTADAPAAVTADDATLVLQYAGQKLVGAYDQMGLAGDGTLAATVAPVTADQTLAVPIDPAAIATQLGATTAPAIGWKVVAAPGAAVNVIDGPRLTAGAIAETDAMIAATYGNPFAAQHAWPATLGVQATTTARTLDVGMAKLPLTRTLSEASDVSNGPGDASFAVPVPTSAMVGHHQLDWDGAFDGTSLSGLLDGAPVEIDLITTGAGTVDLYRVQLSAIAGGTTMTDPATRTVTFEALSRTPTFFVSPEVFVTGTTYVLTVTCISGGYPGVAAGDLTMHSTPITAAQVDLGSFVGAM